MQAEDGHDGALFQRVGDLEYSLLAALGSNRRQVRLSALQALSQNPQIAKLSQDETALIQLFLAQIIQRC